MTWLFEFILHLLVTAALLMGVSKFVAGFHIEKFSQALIGAFVLGLLNTIVRPVFAFLSFPLYILTLGLFSFVVSAVMLALAAKLVRGFRIDGCMPAIVGAVVLTVANWIVAIPFAAMKAD